jgi:hypothetical protein
MELLFKHPVHTARAVYQGRGSVSPKVVPWHQDGYGLSRTVTVEIEYDVICKGMCCHKRTLPCKQHLVFLCHWRLLKLEGSIYNLLTPWSPWSWVPPEPSSRSAAQEISRLLWNPNVHYVVGFEVLTAASMKMALFWFVAPCCLVEVYRSSRGTCHLHHQGDDGGSNSLSWWWR